MFKIKIIEPDRHLDLTVERGFNGDLQIDIQSGEELDLISSSRFKTRLKRVVGALYQEFRDQNRVYVRAILHNTGNTELLIRQAIERYTRKIPYGASHSESVEAFSSIISANPNKFAEDLLSIHQRAVDLDAQLIGMNLLIGKTFDQTVEEHPLKALIWRCFQPFIEILKEHSVYIDFIDLETKKIKVDFRLFNCAMYHFFDNIQKYIKPNSTLFISVNNNREISFRMESRSLDEHEKVSIFNEGYSGRNSGSQRGEGFGMYIFKQVLKKMDAKPSVTWEERAQVPFEGHPYREQVFLVEFPENVLF